MNKLLNHIAQVFRWILKIVFSQILVRFLSHILLLSFALIYRASDRLSTESHHFTLLLLNGFPPMVFKYWPCCQSLVRARYGQPVELILYSGQEKVAIEGTTDAVQELQAAENRQFWITTSEGTSQKCPNYKGPLETIQTW